MSNTKENIELLDMANDIYRWHSEFGGVKNIKKSKKNSNYSHKIRLEYILNELDLRRLEDEFKAYNINDLNTRHESSGIITPKILTLEGSSSYICVNRSRRDYVLSRITEPLTGGTSNTNLIEDEDKLFFMDNVSFPRRKLSLLTTSNGKLNNISRVTKIHNSTKIIANREKAKTAVSLFSKTNVGRNLVINARVLKESPYDECKPDFIVGDTKQFVSRIYNNNINQFITDSNLMYMTKDDLELYHPKFLNSLRAALNNQSLCYSDCYAPKVAIADKTKSFDVVNDLYLDIESIEIFDALACLNQEDLLIDDNYVHCINNNYKFTDISALFSVIGNEKMDHEKFLDTNSMLISAIKSNNQNIIKMMLESLTSYDIDSSIFFLTLIFRNAMMAGLRANQLNTNVSSLYNLCAAKANINFNYGANDNNTSQIIANLSSKGYKMEIPLSFILSESRITDTLSSANQSLQGVNSIKPIFDVESVYKVQLKDNILSHIVFDLDINDFNKVINKQPL